MNKTNQQVQSDWFSMDNHFHLILRSRPDEVQEWSDMEVVRHWNWLCPLFHDEEGFPIDDPDDSVVLPVSLDSKKVKRWRRRLSDISWLMKLLSERIAKWCNLEDGITGHFWEDRFKSILLLDERALLTCSVYVDLNRIQAELAASLESSDYTSVQRRIQAAAIRTSMKGLMADTFGQPRSIVTTVVIDRTQSEIPDATEGEAFVPADAHLAPVQIDEKNDPIGPHPSQNGRRCSDKGFLPMTEAQYIELLQWSADQLRHRHQGAAFDDSPPVLKEMKIEGDVWCKLITQFTDMFYSVAGSPESIDSHRSLADNRFHMPSQTREMLSV